MVPALRTIVPLLLACLLVAGASAQGQSLLLDINPGTGSSSIEGLIAGRTDSGDAVVLFTEVDDSGVRKLWRSAGTPGSTYALSTLDVSTFHAGLDGGVYFVASTPDRGREPWRSDGVNAAEPLPELVEGPANGASSFARRSFEGRAAFRAASGAFFKITDAGYAQIAQLPLRLTSVNETMGIVAGATVEEPVFAFGGPLGSGSNLPADPDNPAATQSVPHVLGSTGNVLCGKGFASGFGAVLSCVRLAAGTFAQIVPPETGVLLGLPDNTTFAPFAGRLAFKGIGNSPGLWATDGTHSGTYRLSVMEADIAPCLAAAADDRLLFVRNGDLWITDATPMSARELLVLPPSQNANPACVFIDIGTRIAPTASWRGVTFLPIGTGRLFVTDSSPANSRVLMGNGTPGAVANSLAFVGSQLIYAGSDTGTGTELWTLPPILLFEDSFD